jgi:Fur family ferric uptake transcriptional regulator
MSEKEDTFKKIIEDKGYKYTAQRKMIVDVLKENKGKHLRVQDIYELVRKKDSKIGFATIYRTINLLDEVGIIDKLDVGDKYIRYEYLDSVHKDKKCHFMCVRCNSIFDIDKVVVENKFSEIEDKYNFKLEGLDLTFYGICRDCLEKENVR